MAWIILIVLMLCVSRFAAVYDAKLLLPGYITVSQRASRILVSGVPFPGSKAENPPENRQKLAAAGLIVYVLTAVCILLCIYNGLTLGPIKALEHVGLSGRSRALVIETGTEHLNRYIATVFFSFETVVYLANDCRFFVSRAGTAGKKAAACTAAVVLGLAVLGTILCVVYVRATLDWWAKIRETMG